MLQLTNLAWLRIALAALWLACAGCRSGAVGIVEIRGVTMGTTYAVKYVGDVRSEATVRAAVDAVLAAVNLEFSTYVPDSVISRFNASRDTTPFEVGRTVCGEIDRALAIAAATCGAFDPTVLPLLRIMPLPGRPSVEPPTDLAIRAALDCVGFAKVEVVDATHLRKLDPCVEIDPNAFAKGHGVDRVAAAIAKLGFVDHLVEIGGELRAAGAKPDGSAWRVAIEQPFEERTGSTAAVVELRDSALATSGNYRQYFESGGRLVHHIFDPRTGANALTDVVSVSVRAADCGLADALATALMVTGPAGVEALDRAIGAEFGVMFLLRSGAGSAVEQKRIRWH